MITYFLDFPAPQTHYAQVEMHIDAPHLLAREAGFLDLKMAVWTPGSYFIREYARMVEGMKVEVWGAEGEQDAGKVGQARLLDILPHRKINKNTWCITLGKNPIDKIIVKYEIYGFELTVRTNFIDEDHAALQGAPTFLYVAHHVELPAQVDIRMPFAWKTCLTALPPKATISFLFHPEEGERSHYLFEVPDYHTLVDSPIALGNYDVFQFEACNIPHTVGILGLKGYDQAQLKTDMQKIVESATALMGENPCETYTFMTIFTQKGRGGLEHLYSTALIAPREEYFKPAGYEDYLTLIAHEYFHLWNVKRLCPKPLDNFDYENENYTTLLWQAEGFTSYYENIIMLKAGLISPEKFIQKNLEHLDIIENQYGNQVLSVADASLDAWIKLYRPHENSANSSISYYVKGAIVAMLLDWDIIRFTEGEKCLDDLMRYLYQRFYKTEKRGFTEEDILEAVVEIASSTLPFEKKTNLHRYFTDFFGKYIYSTTPIPYWAYFKQVGLKLINENEKKSIPTLGFDLDKNTIKFIKRGSQASLAGLSVNDQIVSLDGTDIGQVSDWLKRQQVGKQVEIVLIRDGLLRKTSFILEQDKTLKFRTQTLPKPTQDQKKFYQKWIER
jgi:predicted metalloprotease with PDZ domain